MTFLSVATNNAVMNVFIAQHLIFHVSCDIAFSKGEYNTDK
jgi:hypothetical protein